MYLCFVSLLLVLASAIYCYIFLYNKQFRWSFKHTNNTFWLILLNLSPFQGKIEFTKHYIFAINLSGGLETLPELVTYEPLGLISCLVLVTFLPVSLSIVYLQPGPSKSLITPLDHSGLDSCCTAHRYQGSMEPILYCQFGI